MILLNNKKKLFVLILFILDINYIISIYTIEELLKDVYSNPLIEVKDHYIGDLFKYEKSSLHYNCIDIFKYNPDPNKHFNPKIIPKELYDSFTLDNNIPYINMIIDSEFNERKYYNNNDKSYIWSDKYMNELGHEKNTCGSYNSTICNEVFNKYKLYITNKRGIVLDSQSIPWAESALLSLGAIHITTIEYRKIISNHHKHNSLNHTQLNEKYLLNEFDKEPVDFIFSFSSLEHQGLGRYGDVLDPFGDLVLLAKMHCLLKPNGILFLGIPIGPEVIVFNAHRVYGKHRLSLILPNWEPIDLIGNGEFPINSPIRRHAFSHYTPILVLKKLELDSVPIKEITEGIKLERENIILQSKKEELEIKLTKLKNKLMHKLFQQPKDTITERLNKLKMIALKNAKFHLHSNIFDNCPNDKFLSFASIYTKFGEPYGRTNNNLISFKHSLWLATYSNRTLVVPEWLNHILKSFKLDYLHTQYCFVTDYFVIPENADNKIISPKYAYFGAFVEGDDPNNFPLQFPDMTKEILLDLSKHNLIFTAALWSSPKPIILSKMLYIIDKYLQNTNKVQNNIKNYLQDEHSLLITDLKEYERDSNDFFNYSAFQKRSLEGVCNSYMNRSYKINDYIGNDIDLSSNEWNEIDKNGHPLCNMNHNFIKSTCLLNNFECNELFIMWDGQGNINDYKYIKGVSVNVDINKEFKLLPIKDILNSKGTLEDSLSSGIHLDDNYIYNKKILSLNHITEHSISMTYIDMLISMHSNLFIMNPLSTMSWPIYYVRYLLNMKTIPKLSKISEVGLLYVWIDSVNRINNESFKEFIKQEWYTNHLQH